MRAKSILLLLLALGCGLVASIGITQVMATRQAGVPGPVETESIFVAMKDIAMGDPLTAQMVKLEPWPKDKIPAGALSRLEDIEGRRPKGPIPAGSPIVENLLLGKGITESGAGAAIPPGFRVVPVKVDPVMGSTNMMRPSDRVDVLVHVRQDPAKGIPKTFTRTILQDIKVFAVNDQFDVAAASGDKSMAAKTIWLLVTPEQAQTVMLATELGQVRLVMRSPTDKEQRKLEGEDPSKLLEGIVDTTTSRGAEPEPKSGGDDPLHDLLGMLAAQSSSEPKAEAAAQPVAPPPKNPSWTVRIIAGPQVTDAVLEADALAATGGPDLQRWRVASTSEWSMPGQGAAASPLPQPFHKPRPKPTDSEPAKEAKN